MKNNMAAGACLPSCDESGFARRTRIRSALLVLIGAGAAVVGCIGSAHSQSVRADPKATMSTPGVPGTGMMSPADVAKINALGESKSAKARERARGDSVKLARAMQLACDIKDAEQVGGGQVDHGGKIIGLKLYEVSCTNGLGYLLESRGQESPIAISCFAADATHAADVAQGVKSDIYCQLPANQDLKAMAASLMTVAGTACSVKSLRWFGLSEADQTEYSEVACDDDKGYLLKTARTAPTGQTTVMSCQDAAKTGLKCRLTPR